MRIFLILFLVQSSYAKERVRISVVEKTILRNFLYFGGRVQAARSWNVSPDVSGTLSELNVALGDPVKKGQKLFSIKPRSTGSDYSLHQVNAPIGGQVGNLPFDIGHYINKAETVVTLVDRTRLKTRAQAASSDLVVLHKGATAQIYVSGKKREQTATIVGVAASADQKTGTFAVDFEIDCTGAAACSSLAVGQLIQLRVGQDLTSGIKISLTALRSDLASVFVLDSANRLAKRGVVLGRYFQDSIEVVSGLNVGERVVLSPNRRWRNGDEVEPIGVK